jgi:hypothetical protein
MVPSLYLPVGLRETTVRITGGLPEIPTENFQNTNEEH